MKLCGKHGTIAGFLLITVAAGGPAFAHEETTFLKSSANNCSQLIADFNAQFGMGLSTTPSLELYIPDINYAASISPVTDSGGNNVSITTDGSGTKFSWDAKPGPGYAMVAIKAGNGRTVYWSGTDPIINLADGNSYGDLNTTSKINDVMFCGTTEAVEINGGDYCNTAGLGLAETCAALGNQSMVQTVDPVTGAEALCACPGTNFRNCSGPDAFEQIGVSTQPGIKVEGDGICDPDTGESCCLISPSCDPYIQFDPEKDPDSNSLRDCPTRTVRGKPGASVWSQWSGSDCQVLNSGGIGAEGCVETTSSTCAPGEILIGGLCFAF